jgi:hypothetical protein
MGKLKMKSREPAQPTRPLTREEEIEAAFDELWEQGLRIEAEEAESRARSAARLAKEAEEKAAKTPCVIREPQQEKAGESRRKQEPS